MSELEVVEQGNSSLSSNDQLEDDVGTHHMEDGVGEGPSQMGVTSDPMLVADNGAASSGGSSSPANTGHQREQDGATPSTGSSVWK